MGGPVVTVRAGVTARHVPDPTPVAPRPRRRLGKALLLLALALLVALNGVAFMQARAMTQYASGGFRTPRPEELTLAEKAGTVLTGVRVPRPANTHTPADVGLTFSTGRVALGPSDSLEYWLVPGEPSRAMVLMFPGYAESKESLLPGAVALHKLGYSAALFDFRGAGGSTGSNTTLGARENADVALAYSFARSEWPRAPLVLYGESMGASAVLAAIALHEVRPKAAILEAPFDSLLNTVRNRFDAMGLPAFPSSELLVFWGSVQNGFNGFTFDPATYAESASFPVLLMRGEVDPRVTAGQEQRVFSALAGPRELATFAGAGHEPLALSDPGLWSGRVGRFLSTYATAAP
jgi:alpha-beta hydrolase superfamily lysophospholipase